MNSWKLNSQSQFWIKKLIKEYFDIPYTDVYKVIKEIDSNLNIVHKDGRKFKFKIEEVL